MKPFVAALALLAIVVGPARAQAQLVAAQSEIVFTSRQMGVPVDGRFRRFDAQMVFDPKAPADAKIGFTVDLASAAFGAAEVEADVAKPDWFNTKVFPQATFRSTSVKPAGAGRFEIAGQLGLKGTKRDIVVPVALTQSAGVTTASGAFTLKRLDFHIGEGDWKDTSMVADDVSVRFKLVLAGIGAL